MTRDRLLSGCLLLVLVVLANAADHETFKDCSRVEFCSTLRVREPVELYSVLPESVDIEWETVTMTVVPNDGSRNLSLTILNLEDEGVRIKVTEVESTRYELEYVLDGDPKTKIFEGSAFDGERLELLLAHHKIDMRYSPLLIEVSDYDDVVKMVIDGSFLVLQDSAFAFQVQFPQAVQTYGIHEHADSLALRDTNPGGVDPYRLRNLDVAGYELNSPMALYGAVPVLYAHGPTTTNGVFLHNAAEQWVEVKSVENGTQAYFMVESGTLDLFLLFGPTPTDVVRQYTALTGTAHMPQLWALGYHQCRWNYESQEDLKDVVANFNNFNFPLDTIWLDIEYTDGKKYFTWNPENFSDPVEMQRNISDTHKRLVTIIDPHIKKETGYAVYDGALEQDLFVKNADGSVFEGDCWPGLSSYMDFLNPDARTYYASFYSYEKFPSTTEVLAGIWNDMNEPSVFDNSLEKTIPGDALHVGNVAHRDIHNIYGLLHTMSTHQGLLERDDGATRPFVLTRSHFAGSQRFTAFWTGDNTADWGYLAVSYAECLNANILGLVFCGADVGGFDQNPTVELLQRWYQAGAWLPFYRAHANMGTDRREPYLFEEPVQKVIRDALTLRYQHLPTWYTLFFEHTRNGAPIIRPLFYQYPEDTNVFKIDNQLLLGRNILVRAVTESEVTSVPVYFPGGEEQFWISLNSNEVYGGMGFADVAVTIDAIPVFYRQGGAVVRKDTVRLSSDEMADDGHNIHVVLGPNDRAFGTVYLDDHTSFNYRDQLRYDYLSIEVDNTSVILAHIDEDAVTDGFEFVINDVIVHEITKLPLNGQPGTYRTLVYNKDIKGNPLSQFKLNPDEKKMKLKFA